MFNWSMENNLYVVLSNFTQQNTIFQPQILSRTCMRIVPLLSEFNGITSIDNVMVVINLFLSDYFVISFV